MITASDKNYANALVQLGSPDKTAAALAVVRKILASSSDLAAVLVNPAVSLAIKNSIIDEVFAKDVEGKIVNFLKVLVEKKRFGEFESIAAAFSKELDKINNVAHVEVVSAVDLSPATRKKITDKLRGKLGKEIDAQWATNEEIIAGLVVKIEDDVIDASVRTKIENLRKNII